MDQTERNSKYKEFCSFSNNVMDLGRYYGHGQQINSTTVDEDTYSEDAECPGDDQYNSETFNDYYSATEPWLGAFDRFKSSREATTELSELKMNPDSALALLEMDAKALSEGYHGSMNDLGSPCPPLQQEGLESLYYSSFNRNDFDLASSFYQQNSALRSFTQNVSAVTTAVRLANVPQMYWSDTDRRVDFANMVLQNVGLLESNANIQIVLSKLPGDVYVFDLTTYDAERIVEFITHYYPLVGSLVLKGIRPTVEQRDDITKNILDILEDTTRTEIQYTELIKSLEYPLTISLPIDYERLEEVNRADFHGILKKRTAVRFPTENLSSGHILKTISLRKLSPVVHALLKEAQEWFHHPVGTENVSKKFVIIPPSEGKNNVACLLNSKFLRNISQIIDETCPYDENALAFSRSSNSYVTGEGELKPLEHLAACVPGIEVVWLDGQKCIRKLELNKLEEAKKQEQNMLQDECPETPAKGRQRKTTVNQTPSKSTSPKQGRQANSSKKDKPKEDKNQAEQKITKILSNILKDTKYQYVSFDKLDEVYAANKENLEISGGLRKFVIEHVKHFQVLGEGTNEVVTLSHRAQIKRICNDIARLLRRRNPKCISSTELPSHLIELWQHNRDSEVLDISQFGVCFLDDLMVTIPQHWGVHCSVYVSSNNGCLVLRQHGEGEEDVPDFIKLDCRVRPPGLSPGKSTNGTNGYTESNDDNSNDQWHLEGHSVVHAWMPKHLRTEFQQKRSAFIMQQVLNMFRGDPTAADVVDFIENKIMDPIFNNPHVSPERRSEISDMERRLDTVCLRSNRPTYAPTAKHHVPLDFQIGFNQFIPTFHHVSNSQAVVENYGAKTLFELFDNMADTFVLTHHEANLAKIRLTAEARRDVLERRLIYILRRAQRPLTTWELMHAYRKEPSMLPYYDQCEIERAARECNIIDVQDLNSDVYQATLRPMFSLQQAIVLGGPDVTVILEIFMTSFGPLTFEQLEKTFEEREGRSLPGTAFMVLLDQGALRKTRLNNTCPATTTFDLQDICRTVRNLIYQMTDDPQAIYVVPNEIADFDRLYRGIRSEDSMNSIHYLLEFSGDCTKPYFDVDNVMRDFKPFFEYLGEDAGGCRGYRLRRCVIAGEPSPEEKEKLNKKKEKKGPSRMDRTPARAYVDTSRKR